MKAGFKMALVVVAILGPVSQSFAADSKTPTSVTTCEESADSALCMVVPSEAPESAAVAAPAATMLNAVELSGGALSVENEALLALAMDPREIAFTTPGLAGAEKLFTQQRAIELHLKTIASSGDLTVISAGQK